MEKEEIKREDELRGNRERESEDCKRDRLNEKTDK